MGRTGKANSHGRQRRGATLSDTALPAFGDAVIVKEDLLRSGNLQLLKRFDRHGPAGERGAKSDIGYKPLAFSAKDAASPSPPTIMKKLSQALNESRLFFHAFATKLRNGVLSAALFFFWPASLKRMKLSFAPGITRINDASIPIASDQDIDSIINRASQAIHDIRDTIGDRPHQFHLNFLKRHGRLRCHRYRSRLAARSVLGRRIVK